MIQHLWNRSSKYLLKQLGDFLFPPLCVICDDTLSHDDRWFCQRCIDSLSVNNSRHDVCPVCALNRNFRSCSCDITHPFPFESSWALFDFDDSLRTIMHHIKYHGKKSCARNLGKRFGTSIPDSFFDGIDLVTVIPLHWTRYLKRGYNQADWFGRGILEGKGLSIPFLPELVKRTRATRTQTKLNREARNDNIRNVFRVVNPEVVRGKACILIDDVITTGATTAECSRVLLEAGCTLVRVIALARD